jgi:hypothetical protein
MSNGPDRLHLRERWRDTTGSNIVEAALITPLLLLLTFSIVDFACISYVYLALESGVSQATRYAVTGNQLEDPENPGTELPREESVKRIMRSATPTLTLDDDAFSFSHMSEDDDVWSAGIGGPDDIARVTVRYTWPILTPVMKPFFEDGQIALSVESAMKNEGRFE